MPTLYRSMKSAEDGAPQCGPTRRQLGALVPEDIKPDHAGVVSPQTGGMSVAPHQVQNLGQHRRPPEFGGTGKDPVFVIETQELGSSLTCRLDSATHGLVEPSHPQPVSQYQTALCALRTAWRPI